MKSSGQSNRLFSLLKIIGLLTLCSPIILCQQAQAEPNPPEAGKVTKSGDLLVALHYGIPFHLWSDRLYTNFELATLSLTYEKESGLWFFTKNPKLVKSYLLELRVSRIWGKGIEVSQDQVSPETWNKAMQEGRPPTVDWDHYQIGVIPYIRYYYPFTKDVRMYMEFGLGMSLLTQPLIEDGTTWNFNFSGGFGLDCKFKIPFFVYLKWEHFSNGGQAGIGLTDKRVIGPENMVFGIGTRFSL